MTNRPTDEQSTHKTFFLFFGKCAKNRKFKKNFRTIIIYVHSSMQFLSKWTFHKASYNRMMMYYTKLSFQIDIAIQSRYRTQHFSRGKRTEHIGNVSMPALFCNSSCKNSVYIAEKFIWKRKSLFFINKCEFFACFLPHKIHLYHTHL